MKTKSFSKLALVEPAIFSELADRPHLGCAMLLAVCRQQGIEATLIKGQTRFLRNMFVRDSEELWQLIQDVGDDDAEIAAFRKYIAHKGVKQFKDELKGLYQNIIVEKDPRHYFNAGMIDRFTNLFAWFGRIYFYYLNERKYDRLKIIDGYVEEILKSNPRYVGFSQQSKLEPLSRAVRKRIKELTGLPIIIGGPSTVSLSAKELNAFFEKEHIDYLVIGPGEQALPALIESLEKKREPEGIANVFYRKNGRVKGSAIKVIDDLDGLPFPDYHQFDLDLYCLPERVLSLQDARGCSWRQCGFCSHYKSSFGTYRTFGIERVVETIRHLKDTYNCTHFILDEDELPAARAKQIGEALMKSEMQGIFIYTLARLTAGYNNKALLRNLRAAGFVTIAWGMESASQKVLDSMRKGTQVRTMGQVLKRSSRNGIANMCFVFFGFPGETKTDAQKTVLFLEEHADYIDHVNAQTFKLVPGAPVAEDPERWGITIKKGNSYSVKRGMGHAEAHDFLLRFRKKAETGAIRITSGKLNNKSDVGEQHTLHFLCTSHRLFPNADAVKYIRNNDLRRVFPIVIGDIAKAGNRAVFRPVNTRETVFLNSYLEREEVVDEIEERLIVLSNGSSSIEEIISLLKREFRDSHDNEMIIKRCKDFFIRAFAKCRGLAFAVPWRSGLD